MYISDITRIYETALKAIHEHEIVENPNDYCWYDHVCYVLDQEKEEHINYIELKLIVSCLLHFESADPRLQGVLEEVAVHYLMPDNLTYEQKE